MKIFYDPSITPNDKTFILNEEESGHACRVLRMNVGDELFLLNGKGYRFTCRILVAHAKKCQLEILSHERNVADLPQIHIAIAPTKNMDRIEWFAEKATEMGITRISLILCSNSERRQVKTERIQKVLIAAMKQSQRWFLPELSELTDLKSFIRSYPDGFIAHCRENEKVNLLNSSFSGKEAILIGPEGDFSEEEIHLALEYGYKPITLGDNRLRTETAGLYACMEALIKQQK
ncbi:MAG: 16S rRNA (uracil(1498)-N(3))-methyltransferase [Bacteroidetes bacterium]|nr:MAG: 16S rRNA (uracil(1498)-N(3))-methyltransferase [Bacteroidota bacterium]